MRRDFTLQNLAFLDENCMSSNEQNEGNHGDVIEHD